VPGDAIASDRQRSARAAPSEELRQLSFLALPGASGHAAPMTRAASYTPSESMRWSARRRWPRRAAMRARAPVPTGVCAAPSINCSLDSHPNRTAIGTGPASGHVSLSPWFAVTQSRATWSRSNGSY